MAANTELDHAAPAHRAPFFRRVWLVLTLFVVLLLLALIPPYVNVNRYQRRITTSISASLGRPVHLDNVTLNLLPVPSFTLQNFVVSENPQFGAEPVIRAETVRATLRASSLWRRRIEFSTISLTDPSVNLVHLSNGEWNLDSILLQASHVAAAPTAQRTAGPAPRFPYIEATGARVNLKLNGVKTPIALTEADFAIWQSSPERWNLRVKARPARTDLPVGYTGLMKIEGTLGRARTLEEIPIDLHAEWRGVPLGEMSRVLLGRDAGWRGAVTLTASAQGTAGRNTLAAHAQWEDGRRADFVPDHLLDVTAECVATVTSVFHAVSEGRCAVPGQEAPVVVLSGSVPDIRQHGPASARLDLAPSPLAGAADWLKALSPRIPTGLSLGGNLAGTMAWNAGSLEGAFFLKGATLRSTPDEKSPILIGDAGLHAVENLPATRPRQPVPVQPAAPALVLSPTTLTLGGREPALLDARFDLQGYTLHLTGNATPERLENLAAALPQLGDGLHEALPPASPAATPIRLDLVATRPWGGPQAWHAAAQRPAAPARRHPHRTR